MITLQGKVRDYDPVHDTASIELVHAGMIESWMDGVAIHPAVDRSFVVHGADVTIQVPDPNRLCEAIITGSGSSINAVSRASSAGAVTTQTGRAIISIGAGGSGSVNITFSPAFTGAPNLTVSSDNQYGIVIGGLTTTGATITVTGATPNTFVWISYQAQGH